MDGKRESVPPSRLVYTGLGQQSVLQPPPPPLRTPQNAVAAMESSNRYVHLDTETLRERIQTEEHQIQVAQELVDATTPILQSFAGKQEEELTAEQRQMVMKAKTDNNNAKELMRTSSGRLHELVEAANVPKQNTCNAIQADNNQQQKQDPKDGSTHSSQGTRARQLELNAQEKLRKLKADFEEEMFPIQDAIQDLKRKLKKTTDQSAVPIMEDELEEREIQLERCSRDYERRKKDVMELEQLGQLKIAAEVDEEQNVEEGIDQARDLSHNRVTSWIRGQYDENLVGAGGGYQTQYPENLYQFQDPIHLEYRRPHPPERRNYPLPPTQPPRRYDGDFRHPVHDIESQSSASSNVVADLTTALKDAFREVKGSKEWEPKDLPIFNGKAEDWPVFFSEFSRTTPMGKINSSQNAIRLRKALKGLAKEAVFGLLNDPNNISKIMKTLEQRFGRSEFVIETLMEKAEQCRSPDYLKPETVLTFGTTVQHLVETIKSLGEHSYLNDHGLLRKLVNKLPVPLSTDWIRWISSKKHSPENLLSFGQWIEEQVEIHCRLARPTIQDESAGRDRKMTRGSARVAVSSVDMDNSKNESYPPKDGCTFCKKTNHTIQKCFVFKKENVDEKVEFVKRNGLCFRCLEKGHTKRDCESDQVCGKEGCRSTHHPLLHTVGKPWKMKQDAGEKSDKTSKSDDDSDGSVELNLMDGKVSSNVGATQTCSSKPLSVVKIRVKGPKGTKRVYALLDSGADSTIINTQLAHELGITGNKIQQKCRGIGGKVLRYQAYQVDFQVAGSYKKSNYFEITGGITMDDLGLAPYSQDAEQIKRTWPYLRRAKLESFGNAVPEVIIGEDHPYVTAHRELLQRKQDEPMAKRTLLGWVVGGRKIGQANSANVNVISADEDNLDHLLRASFTLDSYGIYLNNAEGSLEDRRALSILEKTVKKEDNIRWSCGLLWRDENVKLPESRPEAVSRLIANERRMKRDNVFFDLYHAKIDEYLEKGYITELSPEEANVRMDKTMYIPHFGVFNLNKPGKLRLVFDAACKIGGVSLNNHLLTGPDLIRPLPAVLMNFRKHNVAINGDVEDMFHRVAVKEEDRDSQRFVWRDLRKDGNMIKDFRMNVLIFGACSSPSSAIYVKNKNADEFQDIYPEAARVVKDDFYCDDCLSGTQTVEEAILLRRQICEINAAGNFAVKKWLSNSKKVIASIPEEDRSAGVKGFADKADIPTERILGLWWNPEEDHFTFSTNFKKVDPTLLEGRRPTKREMCSLVMSVFDPLGFIANFRIKGLMLLQRTWRTEIGWDENISDSIYVEWQNWVADLKLTEMIKVPRCYALDIHLSTDVQLHTLTDASEEATTAICFLRVIVGNNVKIAFICAKSKVAPIKKTTIPRLELVAAVMGVCLADTIMEQLQIRIAGRTFWTDSRTVLTWIRSETLRYKEFVANRVSRIHLLSNVNEWKWIPTSLNVADEGTRLHTKIVFSPESKWLNGPDFLKKEADCWPVEKKIPEEDESEVRKVAVYSLQVLRDPVGIRVAVDESCGLKEVKFYPTVEMTRFSSYNRMVRAQTALIRAAQHWLKRWKKIEHETPWIWVDEKLQSHPTPAEIRLAETMLVMKAQAESFGEDIAQLIRTGNPTKNSRLLKLSPFLEQGVVRMKGRISLADVKEDKKHPIILPSKHHFTELLIRVEHQRNAHQGQATVLNNLRDRFWIMEGRAAIQRAVGNCQVCKLGKIRPLIPKMGDLPYCRLSSGKSPFYYTGVDLMGPIEVVVGRHREKRWVAVFTCMVTRAVHLEVVYGLSTDETMMALSRFIDQRGRPRHVYSDNGTNFVGAKKELKRNYEAVDWAIIFDSDKFREISWHFNPPLSPHFGGAWERMVQAVKKILKHLLLEKHPKDQTLLTMLKGAENIINSRPLTYASSDPADPQPLTPNHFLRGFADLGPSLPGEFDVCDENVRAQWRRAQYFLEEFWQRWMKEVLPELNRREKWFCDANPICIGDIVLLVDEQAPRNTWTKGVITSTFPGKDGQVRVVEVQTSDFRTRKKTTYRRGVDKICPLGLRMENQDKQPDFGGRNVAESVP